MVTVEQIGLSLPSPPRWGDPSLATATGVHAVTARAALSRSRVPDTDYTLNPYGGCAHGCRYCYATFVGRHLGRSVEEWGSYVLAKVNAPDLLARELKRPSVQGARVFVSSVTDPYQPAEEELQLTRRCLEALVRARHTGRVMVLTRSPLVLRDMDLLTQLHSDVGLTITPTFDPVGRFFEPQAPEVEQRFAALRELNGRGLRTFAFVGPLLPHRVDAIDGMLGELAAVGTRRVFLAHFNLRGYMRASLLDEVEAEFGSEVSRWYGGDVRATKGRIAEAAFAAAQRHGLELLHRGIINHY